MRNSRHFIRLAKSKGARTLAALAVALLVVEPYAYALNQIVSKYPTGTPTIGSVDMDPGAGVNTLNYGSVFGFNSAKSAADGDAYAEIREGACVPEGTSYTFISGMEGWVGLKTNAQFPGGADSGTWESYMFDSTIGGGSLKTVLARRNVTEKFTWEKKFFYDCGTPSTVTFSLKYTRGYWNLAGATNNFQVQLFKPSDTSFASPITLIGSTNITAVSLTNVNGTISTANLNELGTYTLRIVGSLSTQNNNAATVEVAFDDINVNKSPQAAYTSFQQDVEFTIAATPYSSLGSNQYKLDIRAKKPVGDAESTYIQVWNGSAWTTRYTVTSTAWTTFDTYYLTTAEYNGGNVRVRYVDATPAGDISQGGVDVEYQRVTVDQGVCVDQVTDSAADCGKCHNYGGDITKPWPNLGMHNKHAQTESISDCLWCHPNNGTDSAHRDGAVKVAGTKVYRVADGNLNGAPPTANYDGATKQCSNIDCHKGLTTPAWDSVEGVGGFYPNCSRCHNTTGTKAPDASGNLNIDSAWPNDAGSGHSKHDTAFNLTEASCQSSGSCHPDNRSNHSVVGDGKVEVVMASAYASPNKIPKYIPDTTNGTGTCANMACHGGQQTPRFNLAGTNPIDVPTQCTKCHIAEQGNGWGTSAGNASQWNSPISGLHRGSPPTSGKSHIADYGCTQCHNEPAKHFMTGGVSNLIDTAMDALTGADFKAVLGYAAGTGTSPNYTTPPTCSTPAGTAGCHAESDTTYRNPATTWARKWSWDAYSATASDRCKNCHGHWGSFSAGVVQPHIAKGSAGGVLQLNHSDSGVDCATVCHGQTDTTNYNHGVAMTATTKDMTLNTNAGPVDNGDNVGCGACHSSNDGTAAQATTAGKHIFVDATWVTQTNVNGPAPDCTSGSCHGTSATLNTGAITRTGETLGATRHHINGAIVKEQCAVCHDAASQPMNTGSAKRDKIQLRNPDTGATIEIDQSLATTNATFNTNAATFCLGCHDAGGATATFRSGASATVPFGDTKTPQDISAQYKDPITAKTHNYSYNTTPQLTKARSPHGMPGTNIMKDETARTGFATDAAPVGCLGCHPAHGSGTTNPAPAISGGADINTTTVPTRMMKTGYAEPTVCWNCHNAAGVKDYYGDNTTSGNWTAVQKSAFSHKQRNYLSKHQVQMTGFSSTRANARTTTDAVTSISCSVCHDPHGASSWNGSSGSVSYYSFSLRGTWMTSPYLEDRPGTSGATTSSLYSAEIFLGPRTEPNSAYTRPSVLGHGYSAAGGTGNNGYYLDENTFGPNGTAGYPTGAWTTMSETATNFAGLCANCHAASVSASSGGTVAAMQGYLNNASSVVATGWSATAKIHNTVKGWYTATNSVDQVNFTNNAKMRLLHSTNGQNIRALQSAGSFSPRTGNQWGMNLTNGTKQAYHAFSCSKCHTPHASSLPRLMVSNCLDVGTGAASRAAKTATYNNAVNPTRAAYTYPTYGTGWATNPATGNAADVAQHCHNYKKSNASNGWNTLTGW